MGILDQLFSDGSYRTELPGVRGMDVQTPMSVRGLNAAGDFIPGYGDVKAIGEAGQALTEGDLIAAGLLGTGAAIGLIPGAGDAIARPIMAAGRQLSDAAGNLTADTIGAYHSARSGDLGGILDAFAPSRPAQSLSAGVPSLKQDLGPNDAWLQRKLDRAARNRAEYGAEGGSLGNLGGQEGVTGWFSEPVTLDPRALADVRGVNGEEAFRDTGEKLYDLKRSIAEEGYKPTPIVIVVREDGVPFIAEGNHRLAEALQSGRQGIQAEIKYLRGAQSAEGILNPNNLPIAADQASQRGDEILGLLGSGRAADVTDEMLDMGDPVLNARLNQYLHDNYDLPMDEASRMERAREMGFLDDAYHATGAEFQQFIPSEFRGASFFGSTPEGASRGASASANEGVGSGSNITMPVRVNTSGVKGLGAYARKDMNEFRAALPDRIYTEAEVDALMASDAAPLRGNWDDFFDDLTDYDALRAFREKNPDAPIPEGIIAFRPKQPLRYGPSLRADLSGKQFAHYSEGMSERPTSEYVRSQGNTGFTMMDESGLALAMTDPTKIRSRFARFDPRLSHLRNLSAGIGAIGLLGAMDRDQLQQDTQNYLAGGI